MFCQPPPTDVFSSLCPHCRLCHWICHGRSCGLFVVAARWCRHICLVSLDPGRQVKEEHKIAVVILYGGLQPPSLYGTAMARTYPGYDRRRHSHHHHQQHRCKCDPVGVCTVANMWLLNLQQYGLYFMTDYVIALNILRCCFSVWKAWSKAHADKWPENAHKLAFKLCNSRLTTSLTLKEIAYRCDMCLLVNVLNSSKNISLSTLVSGFKNDGNNDVRSSF